MTDDRLAEDRIVKQPSQVGVLQTGYWIDRDPAEAAPGAWIGVDLDGTLAHYDGWRGMASVGAPIPAMVERVKAAIARGWIVKIVTARVCAGQTAADLALAQCALDAWCEDVFGGRLPLTAEKDVKMIELWDDRCVQVIPNTGQPDLVFPARRKVVFVHGCFWHQHTGCREGRMPGTRVEYWGPKLKKNQRRDAEAQAKLADLGWRSVVVWECEVAKDEGAVIRRLTRYLEHHG